MLNKRYTIAGFLVIAALLLRPAVQGQTVVPSDDELKSKKKVYYIDLDRKSKETAESYIYILEQLDLLTADYARYFSNCDARVTASYTAGLKRMMENLSKGTYLRNIASLEIDINKLQSKLKNRNAELKELAACKQEYRLGRHLHEELKTIHVLLSEEVAIQYELQTEKLQKLEQYLEEREAETHKRIQKYYKTPVITRVRRIGSGGTRNIAVVYDQETGTFFSVVSDSENAEGIAVIETVTISTVPGITYVDGVTGIGGTEPVLAPQVPRAPVAIVIGRDRVQLDESGNVWYTRTIIDSTRQLSKTTPILINNPTGSLIVTGWDRNYLRAEVAIIVSSGSERKARKFSDQIQLELYLKHGRLYVEPVIPKLRNLSTQIISNEIVVKVPSGNPLVCKNSFGPVNISMLNGELKLIAEYSQVTLSDIKGEVTAINTNGPIDAHHITGLLKLKNSSGRITVTNSSGTMELENLFAPTELSGSDGDVVIRSTGLVKVEDQHGDVTIINRDGRTEVVQIEGSLFVDNSFGPLLVQEVSGNATIENNSSLINVAGVSGRLTVTNQYAPISVSNLIGPIDLSNNNGNISVYLTGDFGGESTITSTSGVVNLHMLREPNLVVLASTTLGEIKSFFPLQVNQTGQESRATHTFGNGKNRLTVSGKGSTIIFSNAK